MPEQLEKLYQQFNLEKPVDFHSPSMSVSDIVAIRQDGKVSCHYCDSVDDTVDHAVIVLQHHFRIFQRVFWQESGDLGKTNTVTVMTGYLTVLLDRNEITLMNICCNLKVVLLPDISQHLESFLQSWTTERVDAGTVGFVE